MIHKSKMAAANLNIGENVNIKFRLKKGLKGCLMVLCEVICDKEFIADAYLHTSP